MQQYEIGTGFNMQPTVGAETFLLRKGYWYVKFWMEKRQIITLPLGTIVFCIYMHIYSPITRKRSMRYTSSLRSCQPSVYLTMMGESR